MQFAVIHYMMKGLVMTDRKPGCFFTPARFLFSLFDVDIFSGFLVLLLFVNAAHAAACTASAVAAGAVQAALVFDEMPHGQNEDDHDDRADDYVRKVFLKERKHSITYFFVFNLPRVSFDWGSDEREGRQDRRASRTLRPFPL